MSIVPHFQQDSKVETGQVGNDASEGGGENLNYRKVAFRLPDALAHRFKIRAAVERRAMEEMACEAIEQYLEARDA